MVTRQIKYQWDYLYGSLDVLAGQAHFCQIPALNQRWDHEYLADLAATDAAAVHVVIRDQAASICAMETHACPARVRIIDLPAYHPELNACEQLCDVIRGEIGNRLFECVEQLRVATLCLEALLG